MLFINAHVWACATNTSCRVVHLIHGNVMSQMWLAHIVYRCQWNYKPQKRPSETQAQEKREWSLEFFNVPTQFTITIPRKYSYFPPGQILSTSLAPSVSVKPHVIHERGIYGNIFMRMNPQDCFREEEKQNTW